jgi:predicted RNase H-like HicB family nuclease
MSKYTYLTEWSDEDNCYVSRCLEFPSLATHGDTQEEAINEMNSIINESIDWMNEENEEIPAPLSKKEFQRGTE